MKFNCICIALNHRHGLKGVNRPFIYDTPLTLEEKEEKKLP